MSATPAESTTQELSPQRVSLTSRLPCRRLLAQLTAENYALQDAAEKLDFLSYVLLPDPLGDRRQLRAKAQLLSPADPDATAACTWISDAVAAAHLPPMDWASEVHAYAVVPQRLKLAIGEGAATGKGGARVLMVRLQFVSWGLDGSVDLVQEARAKALASAVSAAPARAGTGSPSALTEAWHGGVPPWDEEWMVSYDAREQYNKKITLVDWGGATAGEVAPRCFKHGAHLLYSSLTCFEGEHASLRACVNRPAPLFVSHSLCCSAVEGGDKAHVQRPHFLFQMRMVMLPKQPTLVTVDAPLLPQLPGICLLGSGTMLQCSDCSGARVRCPRNFLPQTVLGVGCGCHMPPSTTIPISFSGDGTGASAELVTSAHGQGIGIDGTTFSGGSGYTAKLTSAKLEFGSAIPSSCRCVLTAPQVDPASGKITALVLGGTEVIPASITISSIRGGSKVVLSNALPMGEWPIQLQEYASLEDTTSMTEQFTALFDSPWFVLKDTERRVGLPGRPQITSTGDSMWLQAERGNRPAPTDKHAPLPLWRCTELMMRSPEGQRECEPLSQEQFEVFGAFADVSFLRTSKGGKVSCAKRISYAARMQPLVNAGEGLLSAIDSVCLQLEPMSQVERAKSSAARASALRAANAADAADGLDPVMEKTIVDAVDALRYAVVGVKLTTGQGKDLKGTLDELSDSMVRQVSRLDSPDDGGDDPGDEAGAVPRYKGKAAVVQNLLALGTQLETILRKLETSGTTKKADVTLHPRSALATVSECTALAQQTLAKISEIRGRGGLVPGAVSRPVFGSQGQLARAASAGDETIALVVRPGAGAGIADEASGFCHLEGVVLLLGGDDTACVSDDAGACATAVTLTGEAVVSTTLLVHADHTNLQPTKVLTLTLAEPLPASAAFDAGSAVTEGSREQQALLKLRVSGAPSKPDHALTFPVARLPSQLHDGGGWLVCNSAISGAKRVFAKGSVRDAGSIAESGAPGGLWARQGVEGLQNPLEADGLFTVQVGRKVAGREEWVVSLDPNQADAVAVRAPIERFALAVTAQPDSGEESECWYDSASIKCAWSLSTLLVKATTGFQAGAATLECPAVAGGAAAFRADVHIADVRSQDVAATYGGARVSQTYTQGYEKEKGLIWSERLSGPNARFRRKNGGQTRSYKDALGVLFDDGCYKPYAFESGADGASSFTHINLVDLDSSCPDGANVPVNMEAWGSIALTSPLSWPDDRPLTTGCTVSMGQRDSAIQSMFGTFIRPPLDGTTDPRVHLNVDESMAQCTPTTGLSPAERARVAAGECVLEYDGPARYTSVPQLRRFAEEGEKVLQTPLSEVEPDLTKRLVWLSSILKVTPEDDACLRAEHEYMEHSTLLSNVVSVDDAMHGPFNCMRTASCNRLMVFANARHSRTRADFMCQCLNEQGVNCGLRQYASSGSLPVCRQFRGGVIEIFCDVSIQPLSAQLGDDGELWALAAYINKEMIDLLYMGPFVAETKYFCSDDRSHRDELFEHATWLVDTWVEVQQKLNPALRENSVRCTDTVYTRSCTQTILLMRNQFLKGKPSKGVDVPEIKNADHRDLVRANPRTTLKPHCLCCLRRVAKAGLSCATLAEDCATWLQSHSRLA